MPRSENLDEHLDAYLDDAEYALDNRIMLNWCADRIAALAQGRSLLELGLGHGITAHKLSRHFSRYLVLDGSEKVIQRFRDKFGESAESVDIALTRFEDFETAERFDHVLMGFILEHVDDPGVILERFREFLNPGGTVLVAVPNAEALNRRLGHHAGLLPDMTALSKFDRLLGHKRNWSATTWREVVEAAGYRIERSEGLFLKPITTQQMIDLKLSDQILHAMCIVGVDYPDLCLGVLMELVPAGGTGR